MVRMYFFFKLQKKSVFMHWRQRKKNHSSLLRIISENWKKKLPKWQILKNKFFAVILEFFRNGIFQRFVIFGAAFNVFYWAIKITNPTIFTFSAIKALLIQELKLKISVIHFGVNISHLCLGHFWNWANYSVNHISTKIR